MSGRISKPVNLKNLHSDLLAWYAREKRALPWRKNRDPYRIWLSEIMLQQTRVEAVLPYYERFLSNFPSISDLAEAHLDTVTNLWAGLGYYSRARNLHACAQQVVREFKGKFPSTIEELRSLKGIGPYTAAAIASIAFDKEHCALDGNLERVFARITAERDDPKTSARSAILGFGESLVKLGNAGDVNQAVMDLASSVCLPKNPKCDSCAIVRHCVAHSLGIQAQLPKRSPKPEKVLLNASAWAVVSNEELLLARRPKGEWLEGMWDLPWSIQKDGTKRAAPKFGEERISVSVARTITKHKITFEVRGLRCERRPRTTEILSLCAGADETRWVPLSDLHGVNLPRPSEKALEKILLKLI